jgi:PAS domain S-box-containing protein
MPKPQNSSRIIGSGEMADLIRTYDWSATPLGPVETWPDILIITVNMLLASRHPMFLWWGSELIQFYNDGYRPSIREDKHPAAVGQRGPQCWPEIWPIIGPQIEAVMRHGESTWNINQLVPIFRNGKLEEVYWTYSYSPIFDAAGVPQGTLVVCSETTEQVLSDRRLRTLLSITSEGDAHSQTPIPESRSLLQLSQTLITILESDPADVPFAVLCLFADGKIQEAGCTSSAHAIAHPEKWPLALAARSQTPWLLDDVAQRFGEVIVPPWPEPVTKAYVLPLAIRGSSTTAVLVFGVSPRIPFDEKTETFFKLIGNRIAGLLQSEIQQAELAAAAERFSKLIEANPFGMVMGDFQGRLDYVNPGFLDTLGYTAAQVAAGEVRWDQFTPQEFAAADARALEQLRVSGRCDVYEKVYLAKNGRRIPILIGAATIERSGHAPEIAAFITDLTALKMAEEALRKSHDDLEKKVTQRTAALEAEIAERRRAEFSLRELTGRLLRTQDEERRHMARELHDHAGQTLSVLGMNLSALQKVAGDNPRVLNLAAQSRQLAEDLSREIRTLSYLLHPPLLDESGLASALRWYVEGFSERSNIKVDLSLPEDLGRLPRELELVIFRVVQEGLTNVHRHSGSSHAAIHMTRAAGSLQFEIRDAGKGIPADKQREMTAAKSGVGIRGMEERVRQFHGTFEIRSGESGTQVIVVLPVEATANDPEAS